VLSRLRFVAPDFSGTIEAAAGFMALLAIVISPTTAGFIIETVGRKKSLRFD
jgi:ABC-type enterochelin transport system permease subunit